MFSPYIYIYIYDTYVNTGKKAQCLLEGPDPSTSMRNSSMRHYRNKNGKPACTNVYSVFLKIFRLLASVTSRGSEF